MVKEKSIRPPLLVYLVASKIVTLELGVGGDKAVKGACCFRVLCDSINFKEYITTVTVCTLGMISELLNKINTGSN